MARSRDADDTARSVGGALGRRAGICVGQLDEGTVRDNAIICYDRYPNLPLFGVSPAEGAKLLPDSLNPWWCMAIGISPSTITILFFQP